MPRVRTLREIKDDLKLIDKNIGEKPLVPYWCDACKRRLMYQKGAPKPQCPYCFAKTGLVVPMRRYY